MKLLEGRRNEKQAKVLIRTGKHIEAERAAAVAKDTYTEHFGKDSFEVARVLTGLGWSG